MFQIELAGNIPPEHLGHELSQLDPEFDDYRTILHEVCGLLEETSAVSFRVQGFGEAKWRVDVATDLLIVLEQLPDLFSWASDERPESFNLDFYEQGVERRLVLSSFGEDIRIDGKPLVPGSSAWEPKIRTEMVGKVALRSQARALVATFLELAEAVCPASVSHPWLVSHFAGIVGDKTSPTRE